MKRLFLLMVLLLAACTVMVDDSSRLADSQARYQSVISQYKGVKSIGPRTFITKDASDSIYIFPSFTGHYSLRSPSCAYTFDSPYENKPFSIKTSDILGPLDKEKTCTVFLTLSPDRVSDKTVVMYDRYMIFQVVYSKRSVNNENSKQIRQGYLPNTFWLSVNTHFGDYHLIGKCADNKLSFVKRGTYSGGNIVLDIDDLKHVDASGIELGLIRDKINHCYFSILYNKGESGKFRNRMGFTVVTYDRRHTRLELETSVSNNTFKANGPSYLYICEVNGKQKVANKCSGKSEETNEVIGHTNKRSFYGKF